MTAAAVVLPDSGPADFDSVSNRFAPGPALRADALVHVARTALAGFRAGSGTSHGDAFRVLIHVDAPSPAMTTPSR